MKSSRHISTLLSRTIVAIVLLAGASLADADFEALSWLNEPEFASLQSVNVVVFLEDDEVSYDVYRSARTTGLTRAERIQQVTERLRSYSSVRGEEAAEFVRANSSSDVTRFWIVPAVSATLTREQIEQLRTMPGVKSIAPDVVVESLIPVEDRLPQSMTTSIENHLALIGARDAWSLGFNGSGRLVASFDTGVEEAHPSLHDKWRGRTSPLSAAWMSTIKPDTVPYDRSGHGTHTMGLMVGSDGNDTVGVAPGAQWITAGVIDQGKTLSATISDILAAFQWSLNPDGNWSTTSDVPDVILNSWGVPANLFGPCDQTFWQVIDNVEAAGIVAIFAAGNEGPDPQTLRNPANRATSPLNSFSVGAVGSDKVVANFSSRGPAVCGSSSNIKPEVVAPGVSLRSAALGGGYRLMSGTSMAAPLVAGMVAIARQYDPNATVEDIKWAIIQSAEDLGAAGEDNNYGYGLVHVGRMLEYLENQHIPNLQLASTQIVGGVARPDSRVEVLATVTNAPANVDTVRGRLMTPFPVGVSVARGETQFFFGNGGTTAISAQTFVLDLGASLYHGQQLSFSMEMTNSLGAILDTLQFTMTVGWAPIGTLADHEAGTVRLTVSDFGQYGLAPGSIYNTNGSGLTLDGGNNLLYEAGMILARNDLQVSSSVRGSDGDYSQSDFVPQSELSDLAQDTNAGLHRRARMKDMRAEVAIPVTVDQETISYSGLVNDGIIIFKYWLINESLERLTNLNFAFLADFDLSGGEQVGYDLENQVLYNSSTNGIHTGLRALQNIHGFKSPVNGDDKTGLSRADQYSLTNDVNDINYGATGDYMTVLSSGPITLEPRDSIQVAFALIVAESELGLFDRARRAYELFNIPTDVTTDNQSLPDGYELAQNYPNPFNPTTIIEFSLPTTSDVSVDIYNLLGQKVKNLVSGTLAAGQHRLEWDGTNDRGDEAATGVYFYRLQADDFATSRKMMLLR